jgi:uncharacterized protein (DUF1810 family)
MCGKPELLYQLARERLPPDDLKLKSCMTLFESVAGQDSLFGRVLDKS